MHLPLNKQVCLLEQAIILKELGVSQDSLFYHFKGLGIDDDWRIVRFDELPTASNDAIFDDRIYSAFTVAELGMLLPPKFPTMLHYGKDFCHCENICVDTFPIVGDSPTSKNNKQIVLIINGRTEAEARAWMLIDLIRKKINLSGESVTIEEYNSAKYQSEYTLR